MTISEKFKKWLVKVLKISSYYTQDFNINTLFDFRTNAARNAIWYRGDSYELSQFYSQINDTNSSFWGASQTPGQEIRKVHSGIPKLIVNTLANITISDMQDPVFNSIENEELWSRIAADNNFKKTLAKATKGVLKIGDGAFKIGFKESISEYPLIEFYNGDHTVFKYDRGRIKEIIFYTYFNKENGKDYTLEERYGYGYIKYRLFKDTSEVDLAVLDETAGLEDIYFDNKIMLAVPYVIFESDEYTGRGQSIFEGKYDSFDSLDETLSQWMDALRSGRSKTYIPQRLIPQNPNTGALIKPNAFDNRFIAVADDTGENAKNEIKNVQPAIATDAYIQTYITMLDLALQGIISPSTLGIDTKKLDNAEAQREKEKATLYTRGIIVSSLTAVIQKLIQVCFYAYQLQYNLPTSKIEADISFGEYANPSFEAVCDTLSKARPGSPIMSIEAQVEEMWGDSKSKEWKAEEVERIKQQTGTIQVEEPALNGLEAKLNIQDLYE